MKIPFIHVDSASTKPLHHISHEGEAPCNPPDRQAWQSKVPPLVVWLNISIHLERSMMIKFSDWWLDV